MSFRRMLPFILVNVLVSAAVVLAILYWWDNRSEEQANIATATSAAAPPIVMPTGVELAVQSTDTPEPETGPPVHVVKRGETLGSLSAFYDVAMEDIMAANNIDNPNVIAVGQQLLIPVGGLPTATPRPASTLEPTLDVPPTPISTEPPLAGSEARVEITAVTGVDELAEEAVQITNFGGSQIALMDWKLADADGHVYTFGQVTLFGDGAAILVHTETGLDGPADLYWGLETPIWEMGERVTLLNGEGEIEAVFDIP